MRQFVSTETGVIYRGLNKLSSIRPGGLLE
jgi:hypothetical protein